MRNEKKTFFARGREKNRSFKGVGVDAHYDFGKIGQNYDCSYEIGNETASKLLKVNEY